MIWFLVAAVVVAMLCAYWLMNRKAAEEEVAESPAAEEAPGYAAGLVQLNLDVRMTYIDVEVRALCEAVIDKLVELEPGINDKLSPAGELRYTINRIATEYFPNKCMRPYLQLDTVTRNKADVVTNQKAMLKALLDELESVEQAMQSKDKREYDMKSDFLKAKFNLKGDV